MCGIAGFVAARRAEEIEASVRSMMRAMERRGPDSEGFEAWPGAGLGHRRLAILDLSPAGHQPMLSEDRSIGVVFNGCIYNFHDLRADLEREGYRFRSNCDTEVLVHGYREWGIDKLVERLRGMFAFAIWDEPHKRLSLVRDRLGVKPLLYVLRDGELAFASTLGALTAAGFRGPIDPDAVLEFLEFGTVAGDQCIFSGLSKVAPATIIEWAGGKLSERVYWKLPPSNAASNIGFEEAIEQTEHLLVESTRLRLISDVPISALLSGGVDSTLVCWALAKLNANVTAFTVGSRGDAHDETEDARQTARHLGIPHEVVELPPDRPEALAEMEEAYSEPFASQSAQALLRVSRAIRPKATVVLTGDGGDEVFLGYPFFQNAWRAQRLAQSMPSSAASLVQMGASFLPPVGPLRRARNFLSYTTGGLSAFAGIRDETGRLREQGILGEQLRDRILPKALLKPSFDSARNLLPEVVAYQNRVHFLAEYMQKVDGGTMYHSLEARAPFLDQKLWEFAASLPPALHLRGGVLKAVLREIVRRRVNPATSHRVKRGFTVPVEDWLAERWSSSLDILTGTTELERQGWIRPGALPKLIADCRRNRSVPTSVWYMLVLEHWLERSAVAA
jgi:asparagine synthase (glutamine-hydrolysing)